jgi:hypothetical protein
VSADSPNPAYRFDRSRAFRAADATHGAATAPAAAAAGGAAACGRRSDRPSLWLGRNAAAGHFIENLPEGFPADGIGIVCGGFRRLAFPFPRKGVQGVEQMVDPGALLRVFAGRALTAG